MLRTFSSALTATAAGAGASSFLPQAVRAKAAKARDHKCLFMMFGVREKGCCKRTAKRGWLGRKRIVRVISGLLQH
jgi:hypothetical protein